MITVNRSGSITAKGPWWRPVVTDGKLSGVRFCCLKNHTQVIDVSRIGGGGVVEGKVVCTQDCGTSLDGVKLLGFTAIKK